MRNGRPLGRAERTVLATVLLLAPLLLSSSLGAMVGCGGGSSKGATFTPDSGTPSSDGTVDAVSETNSDTSPPPIGETGPTTFTDFPAAPIISVTDGGTGAPPNSGMLFGGAEGGVSDGGGAGPCLIEPEVGSLYPNNWLRPRFLWLAPGGENLFELRIHAANQKNDLVVYTVDTSWTMPNAMWQALSADSQDVAMTVAIRGGVYSGSALTAVETGTSGPIGIAPVAAPGAIVYWTTSGGTALKGFSIGDESVAVVMIPSQVQEQSTTCIGCHTSTPDGLFAEFTTSNGWNNSIGSVESGKEGQAPSFLGSAGSAALMVAPRGISATSGGHWATGDHVVVTTVNDMTIGWVDLEAKTGTASGLFTRTGDPNGAGAPTWSHDGKTITYVSTNAIVTGRLDVGPADLFQVPYGDRMGGTATPVTGAADSSLEEYYPAYSPDDLLLAFDSIPNGNTMYNQPLAEVSVIPSAGGVATRLKANDPPACTGKTSPGVTNSWPKWAPGATTTSDGRTFYWLVFSSTRDPGDNPQLYVTPVVVKAGKVTTYQALYLWNQPAAESNHTPAWDVFKIPPPPPPK
jgi:hypothetical protein